jgi:hypothetical protein
MFPHVQTDEARSGDQGNGAAIRNQLPDPAHPINYTLGSVVSFAKSLDRKVLYATLRTFRVGLNTDNLGRR